MYRIVMGCERHILRLLLATIVMIAAYVMPSAASAHDGHAGHHRHQVQLVERFAAADATSVVQASADLAAAAALIADPNRACLRHCSACIGGCAMGCCGVAALLSSLGSLPPRLGHAITMTAATALTPSGIGPQALTEPPRSRT